jgi:polysaccharide export outer membrane protein
MRYIFFLFLLLSSCATKSDLIYLQDHNNIDDWIKNNKSVSLDKIQKGDILKINVFSTSIEATKPYNSKYIETTNASTLEIMKLSGYHVDENFSINFPVLGSVIVKDLTSNELESKISNLLKDGLHLIQNTVTVRHLNSKFTVLGEVNSPGTYSFINNRLNIFQALGYAGDLTVDGKRNNISLLRNYNGTYKINKINISNLDILNSNNFYIKNNDIIVVDPSFRKVKSRGFIGDVSTIAAISSMIVSITLLLQNKF